MENTYLNMGCGYKPHLGDIIFSLKLPNPYQILLLTFLLLGAYM